MTDTNAIIQQVLAKNGKKTFIQTTLDFNKSKENPIVQEVILSRSERLKLQRQVKISTIELASLNCVKSSLPYLLPHQHEDVVNAEKWVYLLKEKGIMFTNGTGSGKALCLDTPIITDKGWVKMRDIKVGDILYGSDGNPCNVIGVFPQGEVNMYRMTFSDGTSADCCEDHLWEVEDIKDRQSFAWFKKQKRRPQVLSTKQIIEKGLRITSYNRINFNIPIVKPINYYEKEFYINPYLLGVILGDGSIKYNGVVIANSEKYIHDKIMDFLPSSFSSTDIDKKRMNSHFAIVTKRGYKNPILNELRVLGLHGHGSETKFIPKQYLLGSIEQRISLLNGLMDTDGYVNKKGVGVFYYTISNSLKDGVRELIESLGGIVSVTVKKSPKYTYKGEIRYGQDCFILCVKMPPEINPFSLPRKRYLVVPKTKYVPVRYITEIESIGRKEAQCISVDSEDKLFAINNYILTHNTIMTGGLLQRQKVDTLIITTTDKKNLDWQEELKLLGLNVYKLESVVDKGRKGINVTTYANFRQNEDIQEREWGIVVYDECHNVMQNEQGKETFCLQAHRKTTNHSTVIRINAERNICGKEPEGQRELLSWTRIVQLSSTEINNEIERLGKLTKVIFLSATPFSYHKNLEYADGYLFDMGSDERIADLPSEKDMFFIDNFGYRFEKGKLLEPDVGTDVNTMEREFADKLLSSGAMSTRKIQLQYDYSREFIKL